jgi:predicted DsbA family dithiol-disulfide isomerase
MNLRIDVISDVVCPWCYVGKRRLEEALRQFDAAGKGITVEVCWRPFQLNPDLPAFGMNRAEYLARKFGPTAPDIYTRVAQAGRSVGIAFAFESIAHQPNTLPAHQLIRLAGQQGRQEAMVETLFRAYFIEGADLTDGTVLVQLAARAGVEPATAVHCLSDTGAKRAVADEERSARDLGVQGVPFFVFNGRLAVSGAQEPEVLARAMETALREPAAVEQP